ncbi:RHS repeat-associated core domain-containing protein [Streptomyces sp. NPDC086783]|uniref:RHS repeat-associated core domain-containing protein n=1 Tax=Streptomyces sp. NPDC086783 TaxID=3365758 RepID=UPI0037F4566A
MTTGGKAYYYLTDAIGSVIALTDEDGNKVDSYTYSPRGVRILAQSTEPVPQPYRFAGGYQDPTGLYHLRARYYDADISRFTQPDPSGQEQNPYLYAEGDPVNRIDRNGTLSLGTVLVAVGRGGDAIAAGQFVGQVITGDYKAAAGTAISFAADKAFAAGCTYPTGGAGAIPCAAGGMAIGKATDAAYNNATSWIRALCLRRRRHRGINSRIDCTGLQGA